MKIQKKILWEGAQTPSPVDRRILPPHTPLASWPLPPHALFGQLALCNGQFNVFQLRGRGMVPLTLHQEICPWTPLSVPMRHYYPLALAMVHPLRQIVDPPLRSLTTKVYNRLPMLQRNLHLFPKALIPGGSGSDCPSPNKNGATVPPPKK